MKKTTASALPVVLIISILMMIVILMAFEFWNINSFYYIRYHSVKQQKMHLSSVLTLFSVDSLLARQMVEEKKFQLYENDEHSLVYFESFFWGLYDCVNLSNFDHSIKDSYLLGKDKDNYRTPALWVCEREHAISLSGNANIKGKAFLPKNGINYLQLNFDNFRGELLPSSSIRISGKELPLIDSIYIKKMVALKKNATLASSEIPSHYHSFFKEPIYALIPSETDKFYAKGKLVLYGDKILVKSSWEISDVLLIAKNVTIESGFSGSLQIVASDTVVIEKDVYLHHPSGIYLQGNQDRTYLHICKGAHIEGYAIVEGNVESRSGFVVDIHYRQDNESVLAGMLYVNGVAHLEGVILGAAYLKECYFLSGENMYEGLIYDGKITRYDDLGFPILFKGGGYKRKEVKKME